LVLPDEFEKLADEYDLIFKHKDIDLPIVTRLYTKVFQEMSQELHFYEAWGLEEEQLAALAQALPCL